MAIYKHNFVLLKRLYNFYTFIILASKLCFKLLKLVMKIMETFVRFTQFCWLHDVFVPICSKRILSFYICKRLICTPWS